MKKTAAQKKFALELTSLIPSLDEEGLSFLIEQARVHLYNMEVTKAEKTFKSHEVVSASGTKKKEKYIAANYRIDRSSSGSSYHLISGGKWKMFNEEEMLSIVRIAQAKASVSEVAGRLFHWFEEERPDTFADLELGDASDPKMKELVQFLRKKFSVKNR